MHRLAKAGLLALLLLPMAAHAQVTDRISVRYFGGMPLPGRSIEAFDLRIDRARFSAAPDQEIDRFFDAVEATLSEHRVVRDWQLVIPDAPWIEITVELKDRRTRLASAHMVLEKAGAHVVTERGLEALEGRSRAAVLARQSEEFRRNRLAFEKLLALTLERARARLSP
jgi:hypothetical protein